MTYDKSISKDERMLGIFENECHSPIKISDDRFLDEGEENPVEYNSKKNLLPGKISKGEKSKKKPV
jgi:hypothetical protein